MLLSHLSEVRVTVTFGPVSEKYVPSVAKSSGAARFSSISMKMDPAAGGDFASVKVRSFYFLQLNARLVTVREGHAGRFEGGADCS